MPRPELEGGGEVLALEVALGERVLELQPRQPLAGRAARPGSGRAPAYQAGTSREARGSGPCPTAHEAVEGGHHLLDRGEAVPGVQPVEVDVVGLAAAAGSLSRAR